MFCFRKKSKSSVNYKQHQENLLKYLKERNLSKFRKLLERKNEYKINPDHVYGGNCNKTCLAEASKQGLTEFIEALLTNGADPNVVSLIHFGNAAIHFAAENGHINAIKCLVQHPHTHINAINDQEETALHLAASNLTKENAEACFSYLVREGINIRHQNAQGQSAIAMAVGKCHGHIWQAVLRRRDLRPEDRELILGKYPKFKEYSLEKIEPMYTHDDAYMDLRNEKFGRFKKKFQKEFVNRTDLIKTTFLQLACQEGWLDIAKLLLDYGADVNRLGTHENRPPVYLACFYGHYDILLCLFETKKVAVKIVESRSLLHAVMQGLSTNTGTAKDGYRECFDYLLKSNDINIPINHCDMYGHTALHYAAKQEDVHYSKSLFEHGAYIGCLNDFGFSPLHDIGPNALEEILDNCVKCKKGRQGSHYDLDFDFSMLIPISRCDKTEQIKDAESGERLHERLPEMSPLYFISRSNKFGHLLKHPILLIFLHLKWTRICILFYLNMLFYTTFVISLTAHLLYETNSPEECNENSEPSVLVVRTVLYILTVVLVFRELMQICLLPKSYFCKLDNILEVCIIVTTILILAGFCSKILAAVTLLLAWMEVILQLSCIYTLAVYNEMMKRVTLNYTKFLLWYFPLIFAFSFSFYRLYRKDTQSEVWNGTFSVNNTTGNFNAQNDNEHFYRDFWMSLLKTVVMMIGELEASNLSFDGGSYEYFLFLFFIFMMTVVLMNLLNGLAVSDTQAIKNDSELVAYRSKVKLVHQFESVVFGGHLNNCCRCQLTGELLPCCSWQQRLRKAISLFPDKLPNGRLHVVLNHATRYTNINIGKKDKEFRPETCCEIGNYRMGLEIDRKILIAAKDIADKRTNQYQHTSNQIVSRIAKVEENLQGCKKQLANLEKLLKQLINNMGQK